MQQGINCQLVIPSLLSPMALRSTYAKTVFMWICLSLHSAYVKNAYSKIIKLAVTCYVYQPKRNYGVFSFIMMDYFSLYFLELMYAMSSFEIFEQKPQRARLLLSLCSESTLLNTCRLTISYSHHFSILAESARENQ